MSEKSSECEQDSCSTLIKCSLKEKKEEGEEEEEEAEECDNDKDFQPTVDMLMNEFDDERTLDEEERDENNQMIGGEDINSKQSKFDEITTLEAESEMPLDELLKLYGYQQESENTMPPPQTLSHQEIDEANSNSSTVKGDKMVERDKEEENGESNSNDICKRRRINEDENDLPSTVEQIENTITEDATTLYTQTTLNMYDNLTSSAYSTSNGESIDQNTKCIQYVVEDDLDDDVELSDLYGCERGDTLRDTSISTSIETTLQSMRCVDNASRRGLLVNSPSLAIGYSGGSPMKYSWKKCVMIGPNYQAIILTSPIAVNNSSFHHTTLSIHDGDHDVESRLSETDCRLGSEMYNEPSDLIWKPPIDESIDLIDQYLERVKSYVNTCVTASSRLKPTTSNPTSSTNSYDTKSSKCSHSYPVKDDEQALNLLMSCNYDVDEALSRFKELNREGSPNNVTNSPIWSEDECRAFELGLRLYGKDFHVIQQQKIQTRSISQLVEFYYFWKKSERHDLFANATRIEKRRYILHPETTDFMDKFIDQQEQRCNQQDYNAKITANETHENKTEER